METRQPRGSLSGLGIELGLRVVFFHWGSSPGFKRFALGSVDAGVAVVMLAAGDSGLALAGPLAATLLLGPHPSLV